MEASSAVPYGADLVRDELHRATETGERRSREALRIAAGLGAGDLEEALSYLRERGEVSEVAPDEFEEVPEVVGGEAGEAEDEGVRAAAAEGLPGWPAETQVTARQVGGYREEYGRRPFAAILAGEATVKLSRGVADALDAPTLGAIVKAGIEEAGDAPFRLEVV